MISWLPIFTDRACDAYIKRVVAIEGDQLTINNNGSIVLNGRFINESYVENYCPIKDEYKICGSVNTVIPKSLGGGKLTIADPSCTASFAIFRALKLWVWCLFNHFVKDFSMFYFYIFISVCIECIPIYFY